MHKSLNMVYSGTVVQYMVDMHCMYGVELLQGLTHIVQSVRSMCSMSRGPVGATGTLLSWRAAIVWGRGLGISDVTRRQSDHTMPHTFTAINVFTCYHSACTMHLVIHTHRYICTLLHTVP